MEWIEQLIDNYSKSKTKKDLRMYVRDLFILSFRSNPINYEDEFYNDQQTKPILAAKWKMVWSRK